MTKDNIDHERATITAIKATKRNRCISIKKQHERTPDNKDH